MIEREILGEKNWGKKTFKYQQKQLQFYNNINQIVKCVSVIPVVKYYFGIKSY